MIPTTKYIQTDLGKSEFNHSQTWMKAPFLPDKASGNTAANNIELRPLFRKDALILNPPYCGELPKPAVNWSRWVPMSSFEFLWVPCVPRTRNLHMRTPQYRRHWCRAWWVVIWSVEESSFSRYLQEKPEHLRSGFCFYPHLSLRWSCSYC